MMKLPSIFPNDTSSPKNKKKSDESKGGSGDAGGGGGGSGGGGGNTGDLNVKLVHQDDIDEDDFDDDDGDENGKGRSSLYKKVVKIFEEGLTGTNYGPPYDYDEYFEGALLFETSQPKVNAGKVHRLLNSKLDPNDVDPDDLHSTPMHNCARYCHLKVMKMLVRAKAYVNPLNEFGQTPLIICVLIKQTINNLRKQLKMAEFLLDCGAHVDLRDKAGMSPLDYAVLNNNVDMIKLLLDYGATVRRDNKTFHVQRATLMDKVTDAEAYLLLQDKLERELTKERKILEARERARREAEEKRLEELRHQEMVERREARLMEQQRLKAERLYNKMREEKMAVLQRKIKRQQAEKLRLLNRDAHRVGEWVQDEEHHWQWQFRKGFKPVDHDLVYLEGMKLVRQVTERRSVRTMDARWKQFNPKGKLEGKWKALEAFEQLQLDDEERKAAAEAAAAAAAEEEEERLREEASREKAMKKKASKLKKGVDRRPRRAEEDEKEVVLSFDFKDDNDTELEGLEDLGDLLI